MLKTEGYNPTSVDSYNKKFGPMNGVPETEGLATRHPLSDSMAATRAYMHLMNR